MTATSTGVGEPKLITSLTISAGSNESRTSGNCTESIRRSRSLSRSMSTFAPSFMATRRMASSGPPVH